MDVSKLEKEAELAQQQLVQFREERKRAVDRIHQLRRQIKDLEKLLPKLTMDIDSFDTTRENLTKLIPQLQHRSTLSTEEEEKVRDLAEKVGQFQSDLEMCITQASEQEADVTRLQKAILDAGGPRLKKQQEKCEKKLQQIRETEKALSSSQVVITSSGKAIKKARDAATQAEKQLKKAQSQLEEKIAELKCLEDDAFAVTEAYEKVKEVAAEKKAKLDEIEQDVEKVKQSLANQKGKEIELTGQADSVAKSLVEQKQCIQHWDAAIKKLLQVARKTERDLWDDEEGQEQIGSSAEGVELASGDFEGTNEDVGMEEAGETGDLDAAVVMEEAGETDDADAAVVDQDDARLAASYPTYSENALDRYDADELKERIATLETERNSLAKNANLGAIAEYRKKEADYMAR